MYSTSTSNPDGTIYEAKSYNNADYINFDLAQIVNHSYRGRILTSKKSVRNRVHWRNRQPLAVDGKTVINILITHTKNILLKILRIRKTIYNFALRIETQKTCAF